MLTSLLYPCRPAANETIFWVLIALSLAPSTGFQTFNRMPMVVSWRLCGCVHPISKAHCVLSLFRALADILRQQGPIPIAHCERETISAIDTSPKENTPVRSTSKNHYTPVRTAKQTPGKWELLTLKFYWFFFWGSSDISALTGLVMEHCAVVDVLIDRTGFCKSLGTVFLWRLGMREIRSGTDEDWWPICYFSSDWCDSLMWSRVCSSHGEVWLPFTHVTGRFGTVQDARCVRVKAAFWHRNCSAIGIPNSKGICILGWPFPVRYRFPGYRMKCPLIYVENWIWDTGGY